MRLSGILGVAGLMLVFHAAWIPVKAWLAQELLERAWQRSIGIGKPHPPWPWADTTPVARLRAPRQRVHRIVLAGASGRTLAFGPGHLAGSAALGSHGHGVIAGHRDTHFSFLRGLEPGDLIELEVPTGERIRYRVLELFVVHESATEVLDPAALDLLSLVTCYPFDTPLAGGPLRYVVRARRELSSVDPLEAPPVSDRTPIAEPQAASHRELAIVRGWIDRAQKIVALTGAGISTDSGIPDFRGPQGLWTKNPEAEKAATLQNYVSEPEVRKASWKQRAEAPFWRSEPNTGHAALVELERRGKLHALITQNVDGLHQAAGNSKGLVIEIHGTVHEVSCLDCDERAPMERALSRVRAGEEDPACRSCGGILKSATISFGQSLVQRDLVRSQQVAESCDLMLAVGSTLGVYPIANVVPVAKQCGARVVIVNGSPTEMDDLADAVLRGSISEILPQIVA